MTSNAITDNVTITSVTRFGEFEFDEVRRRLTRRGQIVRLTGQGLDFLCLLARSPGELVTRDEIKRTLWPASNQDLDHSLDVLVSRVRAVLGDHGKDPLYVETVPRRGFRLLVEKSGNDTRSASLDFLVVDSHANAVHTRHRLLRKAAPYAATAILAAAAAILVARTRYEKFVPSQRPAIAAPIAKNR